MSTMETRQVEEQRQLAESMNKPAEMLEEMKSKWEGMMSEQQSTMRDLVNQTVLTALQKEQAKLPAASRDDETGASAQKTRYFEQRIEQFEAEFQDKERELDRLREEKRTIQTSSSQQAEQLHDAKMQQEVQARELKQLVAKAEEQQRRLDELEREKEEQRKELEADFRKRLAAEIAKSAAEQTAKEKELLFAAEAEKA